MLKAGVCVGIWLVRMRPLSPILTLEEQTCVQCCIQSSDDDEECSCLSAFVHSLRVPVFLSTSRFSGYVSFTRMPCRNMEDWLGNAADDLYGSL